MKKRSNLSIMFRLSALVKPLAGFMVLAIIMGVIGNLCAAFITVLGGYAILDALSISTEISMLTAFILAGVFALLRGVLRYAEQSSNHYIAFKLLALIRDRVFVIDFAPQSLRARTRAISFRLSPLISNCLRYSMHTRFLRSQLQLFSALLWLCS